MSSELPVSDKSGSSEPQRVVLRSYPKIVFLYPTFLTALVAALYMTIAGIAEGTGQIICGWAFLIVLALNLAVISFEFPRTTSITAFFIVVALGLGGTLAVVYFPDLFPTVRGVITSLHPIANATFYWMFSAIMTLIYLAVMVNVRFDYWEVRPNELLHHHGFLSNLERFSSPSLRIDKEINDVFEYLLLGSGRLILHPSNERRVIVLENVFRIGTKEKKITRMLGALQVQVRTDDHDEE